MKVLHVFYSFLPDLSGSSIRSAGLVRGQLATGIPLAILTSPFQPGFSQAQMETYEGAPLYRTYRDGHPLIKESTSTLGSKLRKVALFPWFVLQVVKAARRERADILHAHSTFFCGLAAFLAAGLLGRRFIYEFRSLWEERNLQLGWFARCQTKVSRYLETRSLRGADHIVAINEGLRQDIVARGIPAGKVAVVPNAVEDGLLAMARALPAPERATRFGYIGNFSRIEGLGDLIDGFIRAFPAGEPVQLLFHGLGSFEPELQALIRAAGDDRIRLCGRFTRDQLLEVYGSLDVVVIPRTRLRINMTVTPLKPLEAMAFSRLVVVSDVTALQEVIGRPEHALTFRAEDAGDLAQRLREAYEGQVDVGSIARRGNAFVNRERNWSSVARKYLEIYSA